MATTTRTDTSYSITLLRLHALEEVVKAVVTEMEALWDELAGLEPGGGSGDQQRIYKLTVGGAQSPVSADPQAPTVYDTADTSIHQSVWGYGSNVLSMLGDGTMMPIIDLIGSGAPESFYTSGSVFRATYGNADMYGAVVGAGSNGSIAGLLFGTSASRYSYAQQMQTSGKNFYNLTFGTAAQADSPSASRSMYSLIFGNTDFAASLSSTRSLFRLTFGNEDNPTSLGVRSIFGLALANNFNASTLVTEGKSLYEMIKLCEARLTSGGL
ncbi:hypothetical protein [Agrobacterium sp.]|uniref:hypothetical protein n=1 Tax=Agrobacterium sp. TaxID=361 RepID=UPI00289D4A45|nr:hypothetical protein [Agrobacterium sp.]